jgi:hypothetical protein
MIKKIRATKRLPLILSADDYEELEEGWNSLPELELGPTRAGQGTMVRKGSVNGVKFDSRWEYAFYLWETQVNGKPCERNTLETIDYVDVDGLPRKWIPDFKVAEGYAEVKGFEKPTDVAKRDQHPEVKWYGADVMPDIVKVVERRFPRWKEDYLERT